MSQTESALIKPVQVESSNVVDFSSKLPVLAKNPQLEVELPLVLPVSPSGQFNPSKENLTSDGRTKATPGDSLRSYTDYTTLKNYFLSPSKGMYGIRNFFLLTIGIATGLRISDLVSLKLGHVLTVDKGGKIIFKEKIDIYEKKTGKHTVGQDDSVLITEAIQTSVSLLLEAYAQTSKRTKTPKLLNLDDWLFQSKQKVKNEFIKDKKGKIILNPLFGEYVLTEESAHKIFKDAQRDLNFDFDLCTRTTRKTFASLHFIFSRSYSNGNSAGVELTQISLRHSDARETMHYLGVTRAHSTAVREMISDWLMGRSSVNEIKL